MQDINPAGAAGDATRATADKGEAVLDHVGRNSSNCCRKCIASRSSGWPTSRPGDELKEPMESLTAIHAAPLVSLRQVSKRFANGTLALQGMSLDCGEHDFISLLGPSGCGKSTALRLIAGLTRPARATSPGRARSGPTPATATSASCSRSRR